MIVLRAVYVDGDAWSAGESAAIRKKTGVQGVMSARGLLANPVRPYTLPWHS
jgi:tRNA-dihydrouridine synthase